MQRLLLLLLAAMFLTACASASVAGPRLGPQYVNRIGPRDMLGLANERKAEAVHQAAVMMRAFRPPPGARRISAPKDYGGVLRSVGEFAAEFVQRTRYWRVRAKPASVVAFFEAHDVPAGYTGGCGSNPRSGSTQCHYYPRPPGSRALIFSVQPTLRGTTTFRIDAEVVWIYPRSPEESVSASRVREIDFSTSKVSKQVTDPAVVARIVRWFNDLPIVPPGLGGLPGCGLAPTVPVTLDFLGSDGSGVAHLAVNAQEPRGGFGFCDPMSVTIAGNTQPSLTSRNFIGRVQRAIGVTVKSPTY